MLVQSHDNNGHIGITETLEYCRQRFYWPHMATDIKNWVKKCHDCATAKDTNNTSVAPMVQTQVEVLRPFERIAIDVLGPLTTTRNNKKYILVLQDLFTKWPEAVAVEEVTSRSIIHWLEDEIIPRHGYPQSLLADQGPQFESEEFINFCRKSGIYRERSSIYHHESNGQVERLNRTLENMLRAHVSQEHVDWDEWLPRILFAYRTSIHSTTQVAPFEAVYGRQARSLVDVQYPTIVNAEGSSELVQRISQVRQKVRQNISAASEARKSHYDEARRVEEPELQVGDFVYWTRMGQKGSKKLNRMKSGPFEVVQSLPPANFVIKGGNGLTNRVHANQLVRCFNKELELAQLRKRGRV